MTFQRGIISFIIQYKYKQQMMFPITLSSKNLQQAIETHTIFDDPKVIPHLAKIFDLINKSNPDKLDLTQLSNVVKQTKINLTPKITQQAEFKRVFKGRKQQTSQKLNFIISNFIQESEKLQLTGISLGQNVALEIQNQLKTLAAQKNLVQCRFWGKILGTQRDYYIIQAYRPAPKQHTNLTLGSQKPGQGINYYTFYVSNNIYSGNWEELPSISIEQLRIARKIKKIFTGNLNVPVVSFPNFPGLQKHYLKAQLARMTHSLELSPKGIYKQHDENPKVIQPEEEIKIPDFSELSTLEGWVHKNLMILNLGRCTHFVDPSLPEQQFEAATNELAQKDPQIQRLRGITEDKPAQPVQDQPQTFWIQKIVGNAQVFPKEQAQNVYAVTTLRNLLWPGWITIGYMNGYCNFYIGNGLKASQPCWNTFSNDDLQVQGENTAQFPEPNPKDIPIVEPVPQEGAQNDDENQE